MTSLRDRYRDRSGVAGYTLFCIAAITINLTSDLIRAIRRRL